MKLIESKIYYIAKKYIVAENIKTFFFVIIIIVVISNQIINNTFDVFSLIDIKLLVTILLLFLSDKIAKIINKVVQNRVEDYAKQTVDFDYLVGKYPISNLMEYNGKKLPYDIICRVDSKQEIIVDDYPDKFYNLPCQVSENSEYILDAHKGSIIYNNINIKVDDIIVETNSIKLVTSRTHYFDSLLTNRACDIILKNGRSIREIYEPGPYLKPLKISKMSNHLGFNGLLETKDGKIVFVKRNRYVSIAKGKLSTSVSASLKTKYCVVDTDNKFTVEGLANAIRKEILDELNLDLCDIDDKTLIQSIKFFYRDLFDGGKPQFFIYLRINKTSKEVQNDFYKNSDNDTVIQDKVRRDGSEILLFGIDELANATINKDKNKMNINGKMYNITPSILMSLKVIEDISKKN